MPRWMRPINPSRRRTLGSARGLLTRVRFIRTTVTHPEREPDRTLAIGTHDKKTLRIDVDGIHCAVEQLCSSSRLRERRHLPSQVGMRTLMFGSGGEPSWLERDLWILRRGLHRYCAD